MKCLYSKNKYLQNDYADSFDPEKMKKHELLSAAVPSSWIKQEHKSCQTNQELFCIIDDLNNLDILSQCSLNSDESFDNEFDFISENDINELVNPSKDVIYSVRNYRSANTLGSVENLSSLKRSFHSSADFLNYKFHNYDVQRDSISLMGLQNDKEKPESDRQLHSKCRSAPFLLKPSSVKIEKLSPHVSIDYLIFNYFKLYLNRYLCNKRRNEPFFRISRQV